MSASIRWWEGSVGLSGRSRLAPRALLGGRVCSYRREDIVVLMTVDFAQLQTRWPVTETGIGLGLGAYVGGVSYVWGVERLCHFARALEEVADELAIAAAARQHEEGRGRRVAFEWDECHASVADVAE